MIWVAPNRTPISATRCVAEDKTKKTYSSLVVFCFPLSLRKTPTAISTWDLMLAYLKFVRELEA
jgi:hypothetical protein